MFRFLIKLMNAMKRTKNVEFMPFSLSLFSFLASSLWIAYGLLSNYLLLTFPNI
ncbi:hypothetical protein Scep_016648 [Stephania cephalantha]|uniref:Sugar transporter SWEET1 n=1 Tax=Stephania cephalantha TaxID=152367 RepID=A0AAP0NUV5_9MAGN